ncbi:MAG: SDR family oxidoreductase [Nibricoccus sp.]
MKKAPLVLITGASQGIGAAIAQAFAQEFAGCRLALVARSEKNLAKIAGRCVKAGAATAEVFPCDVSEATSVAAMAQGVLGELGVPDILVNNAGVFRGSPLMELSVEDFDQIVAANLRSVFLVSRAFIPAMVKRGSGDIFNMSSIAGLDAYANGAAYCAAKFGVTGLSKVMRRELRDKGVRVTCVHPGATDTPSWTGSGIDPERMMPAKDIARAFVGICRMSRRTVVEEIVLRPQLGDV